MCYGAPSSTVYPTGQEAVATSQATQMWNYYQQNYAPVMQKYIGQTMSPEFQTEQERNITGEVQAEGMKNVDPSTATANPVENTRRLMNLAQATGAAKSSALGAVRGKQLGAMEDIIGFGQKEEATAQAGAEKLAEQSVSEEIAEKQLRMQKATAKAQSISSIF